METKAKKQFNWRSFVSVLTAFSFIGLTFTGFILFVVSPGRIAIQTALSIFLGALIGSNMGANLNRHFLSSKLKIIFGIAFLCIAFKYIWMFMGVRL